MSFQGTYSCALELVIFKGQWHANATNKTVKWFCNRPREDASVCLTYILNWLNLTALFVKIEGESRWIPTELTVEQRHFSPLDKQVVMSSFCGKKISIRRELKKCAAVSVALCNDFWITLEGERLPYRNNPSLVIDFCSFI